MNLTKQHLNLPTTYLLVLQGATVGNDLTGRSQGDHWIIWMHGYRRDMFSLYMCLLRQMNVLSTFCNDFMMWHYVKRLMKGWWWQMETQYCHAQSASCRWASQGIVVLLWSLLSTAWPVINSWQSLSCLWRSDENTSRRVQVIKPGYG